MQEHGLTKILRKINNVCLNDLEGYLPLLCGQARIGTVPPECIQQMKLHPKVFKGTFFYKANVYVYLYLTLISPKVNFFQWILFYYRIRVRASPMTLRLYLLLLSLGWS